MLKNSSFSLVVCLLVIVLVGWRSSTVCAQAWEPFPGNAVMLYSYQANSSATPLMGAHADSVRVEGADTAYYFYRVDRRPLPSDTARDCNMTPVSMVPDAILVDRDHCFGKKMLKSPNGDCRFVSSGGDTFLLKPQAPQGALWEFSPGDTAIIYATSVGTVLGVLDSLKSISLLSTGQQIVLSKAHGMVRAFDFVPAIVSFPMDLQIWGIPDLGLGGRLPNWAEIVQFDPQDRFGEYTNSSGFWGQMRQWRQTVIQSATPSSPYFIDYVTMEEKFTVAVNFGSPNDSTYYPPDTVIQTYDTIGQAAIRLLPHQTNPDRVNSGDQNCQLGAGIIAGTNNRVALSFGYVGNFDACASAWMGFGGFSYTTYAAGLGRFSYGYEGSGSNVSSHLYCYQKGTESWGTCNDYSGLTVIAPTLEGQFEVFPNPAATQLQVAFAPDGPAVTQVTVLGIDGQLLQQVALPAHTYATTLDVRGLAQGMYVLRVDAHGFASGHRKFVVAR